MKMKIKLIPIVGFLASALMFFSSIQTSIISETNIIRGDRIGAICNDGWRSYSTGSGTCSHHGGVDYWLYGPNKTITEYEESEINFFGVFTSLIGMSTSLYYIFKNEDK
jgi:hypothetical protein